jgi:hypothetical protein
MFVDLENSKGEWFTFRMSHIDPNTGETVWGEPMEGVRVQIRSMKPFFEERISKRERITEWKINPKSRANEKHTNFKELTLAEVKAERDDAFDYAIVGFEGFKDKKTRQVVACTRENKLALMTKDFFDRFIADCQQQLDSSGVELEKEIEKNLGSGSRTEN